MDISASDAVLTLDQGTDSVGAGIGVLTIDAGMVDVEGAGATLDGVAVTASAVADGIEVGQISTSTLLLNNGTSISGGMLALGASGGNGTVDIESAAGATLDDVNVTAFDATNSIEVGQTGSSTLLLKGGTSIKTSTLALGVIGGSTGTVDVESSAGAVLDDVMVIANGTLDTAEVGQTSTATLVVKNGTEMTGGTLAIGAATGTGTVDVESTTGAALDGVTVTAFDATNRIEVGQTSTSTLLLKDGTDVTGGMLVIGAATGTGTVDIENLPGATLDGVTVQANAITDSIEVGQTSTSVLLLRNGSSISGGTLALGTGGGKGTVDVESASGAVFDDVAVTAFDATNIIEVGQTGASTLLLTGGTSIKTATLILGVTSGSIGTVEVETASGATFDDVVVAANGALDNIEVGQSSTATLVLKNGTDMTSGTLAIGSAYGTGTIDVESVSGATLDSVTVTAFDATNRIEVGQAGSSTLLLKNGTSINTCEPRSRRYRWRHRRSRHRKCFRRGV